MDAELAPGDQIADYRIESLHARGGMALVYRARSVRLGRRVALKVLAGQLARDERFQHRFKRESELAASIEHPNIVPVFEASQADGAFYIAMRYIDGPTLREVFDEEGTLSIERTVELLAQVAGALDAAHKRGLIHRDVKPANLLMVPGGAADGTDLVYVTDFGLTRRSDAEPEPESGREPGSYWQQEATATPDRSWLPVPRSDPAPGSWTPRPLRKLSGEAGATELTECGSFLGTIDYVAPEQIRGEEIGPAADQYALACVAYRALTGVTPFDGETDAAVLYGHLLHPAPPVTRHRPDLRPGVDDVLGRALAKQPADRYRTCRAFVSALGSAVPDEDTHAPRRPRIRSVVAAALTFLVALILGATLIPQPGPSAEAPSRVSLPFPSESYPELGVQVHRHWTLDGDGGSQLTGVLRFTTDATQNAGAPAEPLTVTEFLPDELGPRRQVTTTPAAVQRLGAPGATEGLRYVVPPGTSTLTYRVTLPEGPVTVERLQRWAAAQQLRALAMQGAGGPLRVASLHIAPATMTLAVGGVPHRLKVSGRYPDGSEVPDDALGRYRFAVQPDQLVSIDRSGTVTPEAAGRARITVHLGPLTASGTVVVTPSR